MTVMGPRPTAAFAHNFEEIRVTYAEYDDAGNFKGFIEYKMLD